VSSSPFQRTLPAITGIDLEIAFISVDLPAPFAPMIAADSPVASSRPTSCSTASRP
jgi:hypothetical protein